MSLILYGNGVVDNRGSVSGATYSRSRGGATVRAKTSPTQWRSDRRQIAKNSLATISGQWGSVLTSVERAGWNSFALITPSTNVFGQTTYLSGHQWFCKCNLNLLAAGAALITVAPASATVPGYTSLVIVPDHATGGSISITTTDAGLPADFYADIKMTQPLSQGVYYVNNLLKQIAYIHNPVSPYTVAAPYTNIFPNLAGNIGRKVFALISVMDSTTGIESPGIIASGTVI